MASKVKQYNSEQVDVTYDVKRCIHAAECVRGLPAVFDTAKRPWIQPGNAPADAVSEVVQRCPTGALQYTRKDGGAAEPIPAQNRIVPSVDGPLYILGDVQIQVGDDVSHETRLALCRCGHSANKPYCDNAHKEADFTAADLPAAADATVEEHSGSLTITPAANGPLLLNGRFDLVNAAGETVFQGEKAALCRCGGSNNKPFCDGTHKAVQFSTEIS